MMANSFKGSQALIRCNPVQQEWDEHGVVSESIELSNSLLCQRNS